MPRPFLQLGTLLHNQVRETQPGVSLGDMAGPGKSRLHCFLTLSPKAVLATLRLVRSTEDSPPRWSRARLQDTPVFPCSVMAFPGFMARVLV